MERPATPAGDDPFAPAAAAGAYRLAIPTPLAVGRVNVYLIEDEPLTLIDAGPNSGTSFDELQRGIERLGHALDLAADGRVRELTDDGVSLWAQG